MSVSSELCGGVFDAGLMGVGSPVPVSSDDHPELYASTFDPH